MIRRVLMVLLIVLLLGGALLLYWVQDANRFKPELQALLAQQSGIPVTIEGDLSWRLWPPLVLTAKAITADHEDQQWSVGSLALDLDVMTVLRTQDVDQWRIQALQLSNVTMLEDSDRLHIDALELRDFSLGKPSPLTATLDYTPDAASDTSSAIPLQIDTLVTYHPEPQKIEFTEAEFTTDGASGVCALTVLPVADPGPLPEPADDDLINVATLRSFDWQGQCELHSLAMGERQFDDGTVSLTNQGATADSVLQIPQFFGGQATVRVVIDASRAPVRWQVTPKLIDVDSEQLMQWLDQSLPWMAALAYNGSIALTGNTEAQLLTSMTGETTFDGGQGTISISKIKQPMLRIATLLKEPERISRWPDLWNYQRLLGNWRIQGREHSLNFALDNLTVTADGSYDVLQDEMDMLAELQFTTLPDGQMFDVNPLLMDLPIPVRCVGSAEAPKCALVADAARRIVAKVLTSDENSALRAKINEKIDKEVPEQYREAARGLLDLLGGSLEKQSETADGQGPDVQER